MMILLSTLLALTLLDSAHVHAKHRSHIPVRVDESQLPSPKGPLVWGDVNFVHTTDIHGWLLGHQHSTWPEPNYSADTGDLYSFLAHLRAQADRKGVDLLLIDSGDHHDGTGLVSYPGPANARDHDHNHSHNHTDGSPIHPHPHPHPRSRRSGAAVADHHLAKLGYDVLAIGNHELYKYPDAAQVARDVDGGVWDKRDGAAPGAGTGVGTRYLTSNVDVLLDDDEGFRSIGARWSKFKTSMGREVTALGVLYNFSFNAKNTTIQPLGEMILEPWFAHAIKDRPDFFVIAGHMSINRPDSEWKLLLDAIRFVHEDVPVFIFGGHNHVRNCERLDGNSISFAGGRYMETVGWVSANLTKNDSGEMDVFRRYLDSNRKSFKYHSQVPDHKFDTHKGKAISESLYESFDRWNLSSVLGYAPQNYFLSRYPVTDDRSLLKKLMDDVLPATVYDEKVLQNGRKRIYVANSGCQRFDIFKGAFSIDDQYSISPFSSPFVQITLPARIARVLCQKMNDEGASQFHPASGHGDEIVRKAFDSTMVKQRLDYEDRRQRELEFLRLAYGQTVFESEQGQESDLVHRYGYVTEDSCGPIGSGDDVEHVPVPYAPVPDYVSTTFPEGVDDEEPVFVIAMTFFLNDVVKAVSKIDPGYPPIADTDFVPCGDSSMTSNQVWGHYAREHWN